MKNLLKDLFYKVGLYRYAKKHLKKPYLIFTGFIFRLSSKETLEKFIKLMNNNNYVFWLEFGTLLGAFRENKMISHDMDIDVAMNIKYRDTNLRTVLENGGFKLIKRASLLTGEIIEETYKYKTSKVDIFYAYEKKDKIIIYDYMTTRDLSPNECIKRYGGLIVYQNVLEGFDLIKHQIYNQIVNIPSNCNEHLTELYGPTFMISDKNWSIESRSVREETDLFAKVKVI